MLVPGEKLGPFVVDRELGAGAMGAVFRATYAKDGRTVALKVMAPGIGSSDSALKRFVKEAEILKQLNHKNIVRLFGHGKHRGAPYYAMEYIQGESLDKAMGRRGRLTWEEVIELGKQLCDGLYHAHQKGIIHRDLKPSNLMVLKDGTVKLTDFGIAKDVDATQLTSANCTVGTAAYMSPEQCRGERDMTYKSDLYSMGVLFYELLTGRRPFEAESPMDMFLMHVQAQPERPSRHVMDTPIWLDTLILQLLEKDPDKRPLNAQVVGEALEGILAKVEAQKSAGVEAANARFVDRSPNMPKIDETDKAAARTLRDATGKPRRKRKEKPWQEQTWARAVGIVALLALVVGVIWWATRPPSAGKLHARAKSLMETNDPEKWAEARGPGGPLVEFDRLYGTRDDALAKEVRGWIDQVDLHDCEARLTRLVRSEKRDVMIPVKPSSDLERAALDATMSEDEGNLPRALDRWQAANAEATAQSERAWLALIARRHGEAQLAERDHQFLDAKLARLRQTKAAYRADSPDEERVAAAVRLEAEGEPAKARDKWAELRRELEKESGGRRLALVAARRVRELRSAEPPREKEKPKETETPRDKPKDTETPRDKPKDTEREPAKATEKDKAPEKS